MTTAGASHNGRWVDAMNGPMIAFQLSRWMVDAHRAKCQAEIDFERNESAMRVFADEITKHNALSGRVKDNVGKDTTR